MDARSFVTSVYRLAPPTGRPGSQIGERIDAAYLAAIGEIVRSYGEVAKVELVGVEVTQAMPGEEAGAQSAGVAEISDPEPVLEELDQDGEALVTIKVTLGADDERIGVVSLSLRLER
jgi:hypothetical protein